MFNKRFQTWLILGLFTTVIVSCRPKQSVETDVGAPYESLINIVFEKIKQDYVEEPNTKKVVEGALNGMLLSLDEYSHYLNEQEFQLFTEATKGEFGGLGLEIVYEKGLLKVISPMDDTPAAKAGFQPGDFISEINGRPISDLTPFEAIQQIHGSPGTDVELKIIRGAQEPFLIKVKRDIIHINPIKFQAFDHLGYVRIAYFNDQTETKLHQALEQLLQKTNHNLQGLVLDLRNNPGGTLEQAIGVASTFLESGVIVSIKGRDQSQDQVYRAHKNQESLRGVPLVVIINKGSASAAEIVASALKDHKRAVVVGSKSFGKGSVQALFRIPGHGGIKITVARFFTPSGKAIQSQGVEPDISFEESKVEMLEQKVLLGSEQDTILKRAMDLLKGISVLSKK
ncbi:MAG: S41 family peptidase [Proteobacteria bacterium]|nr:S41 family peptidase [Pseudomonadota bacterium]